MPDPVMMDPREFVLRIVASSNERHRKELRMLFWTKILFWCGVLYLLVMLWLIFR